MVQRVKRQIDSEIGSSQEWADCLFFACQFYSLHLITSESERLFDYLTSISDNSPLMRSRILNEVFLKYVLRCSVLASFSPKEMTQKHGNYSMNRSFTPRSSSTRSFWRLERLSALLLRLYRCVFINWFVAWGCGKDAKRQGHDFGCAANKRAQLHKAASWCGADR